VDAGAGTEDDLNWLLSRGYEIIAKEYSGRRITRLSKTVKEWVQDPTWPERSFGWVGEPATGYVRPVQRIVVRCRRIDGTFAYGVLICSLQIQQVCTMLGWFASQAADPVSVLLAYVTCYDQRGGGIETSFKGDKQGLGLTKRSKKRFEGQYVLVLLGPLAHNIVVWAREWLSCHKICHYGPLRMVRDVFHISGLLHFDPSGAVVEIVLNQQACLAHSFLRSLQGFMILPVAAGRARKLPQFGGILVVEVFGSAIALTAQRPSAMGTGEIASKSINVAGLLRAMRGVLIDLCPKTNAFPLFQGKGGLV
jgi:hypothetical protein